nr:MAG TPA: hypothetical protein [Bacteriophage sp.]
MICIKKRSLVLQLAPGSLFHFVLKFYSRKRNCFSKIHYPLPFM